MAEIRIQVHDELELVHTASSSGLVEFGRQADGEAPPFATYPGPDQVRIVFAPKAEQSVSRHHFTAEPLGDRRVRIRNTGRFPLVLDEDVHVHPGESRELTLPVVVNCGAKTIGIEASVDSAQVLGPHQMQPSAEDDKIPLESLRTATRAPGTIAASGRLGPESLAAYDIRDDTMLRWLQAAMDVLQSAASSSEFFEKAAGALIDLVGLDSGQVLLHKDGNWVQQTRKTSLAMRSMDEKRPSRKVLSSVLSEKRTFWQVVNITDAIDSLAEVTAVVAAPILDGAGAVLGTLYGDRRSGGTRGKPGLRQVDAVLVELLAGGVAAGVLRIEREQRAVIEKEKTLKLEREIEICRDIQRGFLPDSLPSPAKWELVAYFEPARRVGGDFYDCFTLSENQIVLVIADVCDKGVGPALYAALSRSLIRAFCQQTGLGTVLEDRSSETLPAKRRQTALLAVENTHKYLVANHPFRADDAKRGTVVTLFLGVLDTSTGDLSYVNAGHDMPTILGSRGVKARLEKTGWAIGFEPDVVFEIAKTKLEPGDILLMHTDGVTDARSISDQHTSKFQEQRFLSLLQGENASAKALVDRIVGEVRAHIGTAEQYDDITLLAVRRMPE